MASRSLSHVSVVFDRRVGGGVCKAAVFDDLYFSRLGRPSSIVRTNTTPPNKLTVSTNPLKDIPASDPVDKCIAGSHSVVFSPL